MKTALLILIAVLTMALAGCVASGKPKVATPPAPQPAPAAPAPQQPAPSLSLPQTEIQLPPAQPVDPEALAMETPAEAHPETPSRGTSRRPSTPAAAPPAAAPHIETPTPLEPERGQVREVLPASESRRLKATADAHKRDIRAWLNSSRGRKLDPNNPTVVRLRSFLKGSDEAEEKDDMREAFNLAERALILMRELQSVR